MTMPPSKPPPQSPAGDALVPPPYGGVAPLYERLRDLLARAGVPVMSILLLTFTVPQVAYVAVIEVALEGVVVAGPGLMVPSTDDSAPTGPGGSVAGTFGWVVLPFLLVTLIGALGWAASIWAVTQVAVGQPVSVGVALRAGRRWLAPMFGWYVLYTAIIAIGLLVLIVPGIYAVVAGCLFSFAVVYERGRNPMVRAVSLMHRNILAVLGRFALLALFLAVAFCAVATLVSVTGLGVGDPEADTGGRFAGNVILALAVVPVYAVLLVGLLLTYTQVRARQEEITTAQLWAEANQDVATG